MDAIRLVLGDIINFQSETLSRQQDDIADTARASRNITIAAISGAVVATMIAMIFALGAVVARRVLGNAGALEQVLPDMVTNAQHAMTGRGRSASPRWPPTARAASSS